MNSLSEKKKTIAAASQKSRSTSAPPTAVAITANMLSLRWYTTPAAARARSGTTPTATHASAKYENGSTYQSSSSMPSATRFHVPNETPKRTPHTMRSAVILWSRTLRFRRLPPPDDAPPSSTFASRSAQLSARTSRSGAVCASCVTATRRSIRLTATCETPGSGRSLLLTSSTSDWQHMP